MDGAVSGTKRTCRRYKGMESRANEWVYAQHHTDGAKPKLERRWPEGEETDEKAGKDDTERRRWLDEQQGGMETARLRGRLLM